MIVNISQEIFEQFFTNETKSTCQVRKAMVS